jgi:hypothetical protein
MTRIFPSRSSYVMQLSTYLSIGGPSEPRGGCGRTSIARSDEKCWRPRAAASTSVNSRVAQTQIKNIDPVYCWQIVVAVSIAHAYCIDGSSCSFTLASFLASSMLGSRQGPHRPSINSRADTLRCRCSLSCQVERTQQRSLGTHHAEYGHLDSGTGFGTPEPSGNLWAAVE